MALVTRAEFDALLAALVEDNTSGSITPTDLRSVFDSLMDSVIWYNEASDGGGGGEGSGDVVGPASATAERVALFDGTTGKLIKQGSGPPVIGAGTVTDGRAVIFSGTTGTAIAQAAGAPVLGPGTVTSGRAVLFSGTSGNAISAAAGAPVLGPGAVTSGRAVVFSGTSGDLLAQAAGAPVLGPGAVTSGHVALFSGTSGDLLSSGGAAPVLNTAAGLAAISTTTAADGTHGPTFGTAAFDAMIAMTTANVLEKLGGLFAKAGYDATGISSALTVATGDLAVFGPMADTGFRSLTNVALTAVEQEADSFFTTNSTGGGQYSTFLSAWQKIQEGRPYTGVQTATLISNVIQFSCEDGAGRHILAPSALTANSTLSASVWDGILDGEEPVLLRIETGGTGRTFTPTTHADGMFPWYDTTVIFTANSYTLLSLFRLNNVPQVVKLATALISGAADPDPEFIDHEVAVNNPTSATIPPHTAGDLEVYIVHFGGGSALPGIPGSLTDFPVDTDAPTQPATRIAYRTSASTEASNTTLAGFSGTSSIHCLIFHQAGGGTPVIDSSFVFASTIAGTTTIPFASCDAGVNAIYVHHAGLQTTDLMSAMPAGTTALATGSSGGDVNNHNYVSYTGVLATPGWVSANGTKSATGGRCNAVTIAITAG